MIYRTLLIDDEEPARIRLRELLTKHSPTIEIVGEATNGIEAVDMIKALTPNLVFLDIQMPGKDGFEVLQSLEKVPYVIFCTAFDQYALKAFETNSIDYLIKPLKAERLEKALEKLQNIQNPSTNAAVLQLVEEMLQKRVPQPITSIPVKVGDRVIFVKIEDIAYFEAKNKYVEVHTRQGKQYDMDQSLKYLEEKLPQQFIRVHRAMIVNTQLILEIRRYLGSKFSIVINDIKRSSIVSGREYSEEIKRLWVI